MLLFLLCTLSTLSHGIRIIIQCIIYDLEVTKLIKLLIELIKCKSKIRAMHGAAAPFHCRNHQLIYFPSMHASYLQLFKGVLLQVQWAKIWLGEGVIPCAPSEVPAEVEVVLGWYLGTAVHKPFPHGCFHLSITSLNERKHGMVSFALISYKFAQLSVCMR